MLCYVSLEDVEQALIQVLEAKAWDMDDKHRKQWCCSSTARFRVMARHVQQARLKNAKWTQAFQFTDEGQDDEGEAEGEETPLQAHGDDHAATYIVGWDPEQNKAWKMNMDATFRDFAKEVKVPEGAAAEDPVVATFADGSVIEIPEYTCGDFQATGTDDDQPKLKSPYYRGRLPDAGLVTIKDRKNNGVLFLAVACPEGQIAQCRGDHFGTVQDTLQKLIPLAEKYVKGNINRVELKKQLEMVKQDGGGRTSEVTTSAAAAAPAAAAAAGARSSSEKPKGSKRDKPQGSKSQPEPQTKKAKPDESDIPMFDDEDALPMGLDE